MLRSIGAVVGGYVAMALAVILGILAATAALVPGGLTPANLEGVASEPPSATFLAADLLIGLVAAILGGWLTARLAPSTPLRHVGALGIVMVLVAIPTAIGKSAAPNGQPAWYCAVVVTIGLVGILLGAWLQMRGPGGRVRSAPAGSL
jgi:hypothetical protein